MVRAYDRCSMGAVMSMILCAECGELCDCDEYPEGFYRGEDDEPSDEFYCASCNEGDW